MAAHTTRTIRSDAQIRDAERYHVSTLGYFARSSGQYLTDPETCSITRWCSTARIWGNSNQHQHYDVPHVLVGGAGGKLKGGRHLAYERKSVTTGNLLVSILEMYGIETEGQGDSTGRLAKL